MFLAFKLPMLVLVFGIDISKYRNMGSVFQYNLPLGKTHIALPRCNEIGTVVPVVQSCSRAQSYSHSTSRPAVAE